MPPSLHQKHLKLIEYDKSPELGLQNQPRTTINNVSSFTSNFASQLSFGANKSQVEDKGNGKNILPSGGESYIYSSVTNIMPNSIANSIQLRKTQGTFMINGQYASLSSKERKENSKEKDSIRLPQHLQISTNSQQQQHNNHYIPKDYSRPNRNKRMSKRSINLNIKSDAPHEDDSVINITINLTGARTNHNNNSIEVKNIFINQQKISFITMLYLNQNECTDYH